MPPTSKRFRGCGSIPCKGCGAVLPESEFFWQKDKKMRGGGYYRQRCRKCQTFRSKFYYAQRREYYQEAAKDRYWEHPQYIRDGRNGRYWSDK
jgi:hypothetical protein